ncbi:MAG TPA: hypothetical protein VFC87_05455 [Perlabentimonas sp.]|nr:hypothetical protein [Perlabentimonas sp.]
MPSRATSSSLVQRSGTPIAEALEATVRMRKLAIISASTLTSTLTSTSTSTLTSTLTSTSTSTLTSTSTSTLLLTISF